MSTDPDPYGAYGQCDVCLKERHLNVCWVTGIETWACAECRGDDGDYDDGDRYEHETGEKL